MKVQITDVEFDFTVDPEFAITPAEQAEVVNKTLGMIILADEESEIPKVIEQETDWLVESYSYTEI